jgi:hypothetical protein
MASQYNTLPGRSVAMQPPALVRLRELIRVLPAFPLMANSLDGIAAGPDHVPPALTDAPKNEIRYVK